MIPNIKKCNVCKVVLSPENSYYPKTHNYLCRKHHYETHTVYYFSTKGKAVRNAASKRAYLKHKHKWVARAKLRYAVKKGIIIKPKWCEVCELVKPLQGHHEDYSKPLEVIWLCTGCHADADRILESKSPSKNKE